MEQTTPSINEMNCLNGRTVGTSCLIKQQQLLSIPAPEISCLNGRTVGKSCLIKQQQLLSTPAPSGWKYNFVSVLSPSDCRHHPGCTTEHINIVQSEDGIVVSF